MRVNRRFLLAALTAILLLSVTLFVWNWHCRRYAWPQEIQISVLGVQVARCDELVSSEGFSAYGQGVFRWTYRIAAKGSSPLAQFCYGHGPDTCQFSKTKRLNDGVVQSVTYDDGMLTVEEIWD